MTPVIGGFWGFWGTYRGSAEASESWDFLGIFGDLWRIRHGVELFPKYGALLATGPVNCRHSTR
jgi:hypothetical protein